MVDNILIPHDAIQALANGTKQPTKLDRVQPLFTLRQASRVLGMNLDEIRALLRSKSLFGVMYK